MQDLLEALDQRIRSFETDMVRYREGMHPHIILGWKAHLKDLQRTRALLAAVIHSANGCLVPPDGGSPNVQDHIDTAKAAIEEYRKLLAESPSAPRGD